MLSIVFREIIELQGATSTQTKGAVHMTKGWSYLYTVAFVGTTVMVLGYVVFNTVLLPVIAEFQKISTILG